MPGKNGRYVLNSYSTDRGLSSPLIPVLDRRVGPVLHDLATYVELMNVDAVTPDLWQRVRGMSNDHLRYAAMSDVVRASYKFGLSAAAAQARVDLASQVSEAIRIDGMQARSCDCEPSCCSAT